MIRSSLHLLLLLLTLTAIGCQPEVAPDTTDTVVASADDGVTAEAPLPQAAVEYLASLGGSCGDGSCSPPEDCQSCPGDCGGCCGNGACDNGEDCNSCPGDCGKCCGDNKCNPPEDCQSCPGDCGPCQ